MEEQTEAPSLVRAWTDDAGTVHLLCDRVRPDQVARVIGHEILGHHGLRAVFGDQFDTFLDDVYNLHSSEIDGYAERYKADPESDEGRRYLTEEFLADCADAKAKPSWWKEFLARCREFLDRVVGRHHFSDLDIEAALSRSARAVRKKRGLAFDRENDGVRFSLFDNQRKSSLVIDALKKIAAGEEEVTVAKLRDDLEQYGGTNDISFGWGNEKKGIYHIAYRRGINTLFHVIDAVSDGRILRYTAGNKTVVLEKDGYEAVLALTEFGNRKSWLLSGWKKNEPDAVGEVGTQSNATQSTPTFSRHELGAGLESIIAQSGENASPGTGKIEENPGNGTGNTEEGTGGTSRTGGMRFSVAPVYTGSAADYDRPSLHFVGTGEGAQVYGWGLYGSSSEDVARWYAQKDAERKKGYSEEYVPYRFLLDGESNPSGGYLSFEQLEKICSEMETENDYWVPREIENVFIHLYHNAFDRNGNMNLAIADTAEEFKDGDEAEQAALAWIKKNHSRLEVKDDLTGRRNLYEQTFWPDKQENLLDWDEDVPVEQAKKIWDTAEKEDLFKDIPENEEDYRFEASYKQNVYLHTYLGAAAKGEKVLQGRALYDTLSQILGSPKAASEFLYRAGIDGITYVGDASGVRNYVAFSDQDVRVDNHLRFSMGEPDENTVRLVSQMRIIAGENLSESGETYAEKFKKVYGVDLDPKEAKIIAAMAVDENRKEYFRRYRKNAIQFYRESDPAFDFFLNFAGPEGKLNPGRDHLGEEFTGTYGALIRGRGALFRGPDAAAVPSSGRRNRRDGLPCPRARGV